MNFAHLEHVPRYLAVAVGLVLLDAVVRFVLGEPYLGATFLLAAACGVVLLPLLPVEVCTLPVRLAILPALSLGSFSLLLTTASIVGVPLTEVWIRGTVGLFVLAAGVAAAGLGDRPRRERSARREAHVLAALTAVFAISLASSLDVVRPFPPPGSDWGNYLLYADEVAVQHHLLIENPYTVGEARLFGNYPGIGSIYGSLRILDGVSSQSLALGIAFLSALTPLSVFAAVGTLWGATAGLLAAAAYAVAPVRLEPLYWHGLGTTYALLFLPLVVLALGLMYRGNRRWRSVGLLGFSLAAVLVAHYVTFVVAAVLVAAVVAADLAVLIIGRSTARKHAMESWWRRGMFRPVVAGALLALLIGGGVLVHMWLQAADLGPALGYEHFGPGSFGVDTVVDYFSRPFLALFVVCLVSVVLNGEARRDPAFLAVAGLAVAALLVTQLWRFQVAYDYRRAVYYLAIPMVVVAGVAPLRFRYRWRAVAAYVVALAFVAHVSIGLRLPQRLFTAPESRSASVDGLRSFGERLDRRDPAGETLLVADSCLGAKVPYFVRRPTLIAGAEWQVGFERLVAPARAAEAILAGGPRGRDLAARLGVDYVLADPRCTPNAARRLGGETVSYGDAVVVVALPRAGDEGSAESAGAFPRPTARHTSAPRVRVNVRA